MVDAITKMKLVYMILMASKVIKDTLAMQVPKGSPDTSGHQQIGSLRPRDLRGSVRLHGHHRRDRKVDIKITLHHQNLKVIEMKRI